jgi:hypothetical protein
MVKLQKKADYQYILTQLQNKLTAWKANNLSFAGRVTLSKSVMEAIPLYSMMTTKIPLSILQQAHKLQRSFIWGDSESNRHFHAINWNTITQPKRLGGLGLRRLDMMNKACIMKLGWNLQQGSNDLWCTVLVGKYGRGVTNLANPIVKPSDSSLWKYLVSVMPWIEEDSCKAIGDGQDTMAWESCWIAKGLRVTDLEVDIPHNMRNVTVAELVSNDESWSWHTINWLPEFVLNMLVAIPVPLAANGPDVRFWPSENHGQFTVASAYDLLMDYDYCAEESSWKKIWKLQVPERVKCFI